MSEQHVHIVVGETGEYSDWQIWYVRAFVDKQAAETLSGKLNQWCRDNGCHESSGRQRNAKPPDDDQFRADYTGTTYSVMTLPLEVAATLRNGTPDSMTEGHHKAVGNA
jgi:hypothetical protein